jgi:hypothetical protein
MNQENLNNENEISYYFPGAASLSDQLDSNVSFIYFFFHFPLI